MKIKNRILMIAAVLALITTQCFASSGHPDAVGSYGPDPAPDSHAPIVVMGDK